MQLVNQSLRRPALCFAAMTSVAICLVRETPVVSTLSELVWRAHRSHRRRHRPAAFSGRRLGHAGRSVLRRPAAVRAHEGLDVRGVHGRRPGAARDRARRSTPRTWWRTTLRRWTLSTAVREGRIVREGDPEWERGVPVRVEAVPVRSDGRVIAVLARDTNLSATRSPSALELAYLRTAGDLVQMVAEGTFPFEAGFADSAEAPRVGDGMIRLDGDGVIAYASPNAVSAYRRLGHNGNLAGESARRGAPSAAGSRRATPRDGRRRDPAGAALSRSGTPAGAHRRRDRARRHDRAAAGHPAHAGCGARHARARARCDRAAPPRSAAALQGRDHPGDPSPGEEQPADRRRAAAAAGPAHARPGGAAGAAGVGPPGHVDRAGARDALAEHGRGGRLRRGRRSAVGDDGGRRRDRLAGVGANGRARSGSCRARWPRRSRWCSPS